MNRPLFSHVPLAMASCPQLLVCPALCRKNPLLEEHTSPCAQGIFSRNVLMKKFTCIEGENPTIVLQFWKTETSLAKLTPQHYREILIRFKLCTWHCLVQHLGWTWAELEAAHNIHPCTQQGTNPLDLSPTSPKSSGSWLIAITIEFSQ